MNKEWWEAGLMPGVEQAEFSVGHAELPGPGSVQVRDGDGGKHRSSAYRLLAREERQWPGGGEGLEKVPGFCWKCTPPLWG